MFNFGAAAGGFDSKRKNKTTPPRGRSCNRPPVTGLIRSSKTAAVESYVTKRHWIAQPPQCHKVFPDWLNKNTQSAKVPVSHLGQHAPPLKGKAAYFSGFSASPFSPLGGRVCKHGETGDSPARHRRVVCTREQKTDPFFLLLKFWGGQ